MIPVGVLLQAGFEVLAAKMKKTPASRGCPLRAAPLHQRQQNFHKSSRFSGTAMARQFVYFMQGLSKTYPGNRKVLDNVHLSLYPDAKIGVLGVNGSRKSTLLRSMAAIAEEYNTEAWVRARSHRRYLHQ